jgi:hypothetical protein
VFVLIFQGKEGNSSDSKGMAAICTTKATKGNTQEGNTVGFYRQCTDEDFIRQRVLGY